jgi:hypothetical protein
MPNSKLGLGRRFSARAGAQKRTEVPNPKLKAPTKLQTPSSNNLRAGTLKLGAWSLELLLNFEL